MIVMADYLLFYSHNYVKKGSYGYGILAFSK